MASIDLARLQIDNISYAEVGQCELEALSFEALRPNPTQLQPKCSSHFGGCTIKLLIRYIRGTTESDEQTTILLGESNCKVGEQSDHNYRRHYLLTDLSASSRREANGLFDVGISLLAESTSAEARPNTHHQAPREGTRF